MTRVAELDYIPDSAERFRRLTELPLPVFLDSSGGPDRGGGRYDILSADPYLTLTTRGMQSEIRSRDRVERSTRDPLRIIKDLLGERVAAPRGLPFAGGAIGYFAYDLGRRFEQLPALAIADVGTPDLAIGIYDWAVVVDHLERRSFLVGQGRDGRTFSEWERLLVLVEPRPQLAAQRFKVLSPVCSSWDRRDYERAFERIKTHIRAGDCYQVNLTQRFEARVDGDAWAAYLRLREINPAPFSAFLRTADADVLSSSPESFLRVRDGHVQTKPIKGTRPRSSDPARDRALIAELEASGKDRAENVMIVDLLRNDLGKLCQPGSVRVTKLFDIESFASVHHLVSTIEGRLPRDKHALDLLAACFPGGSITGAPKVRAMQIIEALEPYRRGVYCGAIGYVGFNGNLDLNIAIRTLVHSAGRIFAWAGGGVVADSAVDAEYQESLDKAAALLAVLRSQESIRAV